MVGHPLGQHHDEGGVEARMLMAWVSGCKRFIIMCPKAPRRSFRIVVVRGGCPVLIRFAAFAM